MCILYILRRHHRNSIHISFIFNTYCRFLSLHILASQNCVKAALLPMQIVYKEPQSKTFLLSYSSPAAPAISCILSASRANSGVSALFARIFDAARRKSLRALLSGWSLRFLMLTSSISQLEGWRVRIVRVRIMVMKTERRTRGDTSRWPIP